MFYCWEIRKYHRQNICDLKVLIDSHCRRRLMSIIARKILQRIFGNHVSFLGQCIYYLASISKCSVMRSTIFLLCSLTMSIIYLWIFVILDDDCDLPTLPWYFLCSCPHLLCHSHLPPSAILTSDGLPHHPGPHWGRAGGRHGGVQELWDRSEGSHYLSQGIVNIVCRC